MSLVRECRKRQQKQRGRRRRGEGRAWAREQRTNENPLTPPSHWTRSDKQLAKSGAHRDKNARTCRGVGTNGPMFLSTWGKCQRTTPPVKSSAGPRLDYVMQRRERKNCSRRQKTVTIPGSRSPALSLALLCLSSSSVAFHIHVFKAVPTRPPSLQTAPERLPSSNCESLHGFCDLGR